MTELSPAAQAVLNAFKDQVELTWLTKDPEQVGLAAALRAAADEIEYLYCESDVDSSDGLVFALGHLFLIAGELEGLNETSI